MAQTNFTPISLYFSATATSVPTAGNLVAGELAINTNDGKLFYKDSSGVVQTLASKAGALGDVVGPASATDNALARFDLTTGKLIQNSIGILSDAGALSGLTDVSTGTLSATGVATFSAGTAALPAITTTGDTNTGIFFPAADTIAFTEGGAESMRIDSSGNVGIGTSSPYSKLDIVQGTAGFGSWKYCTSLNATDYPALRFLATTGNTGNLIAHDAGNLVFLNGTTATVAGTERMRINSSGELLIGTTTSLASGLTVSAGNGPQFSLNTTTRYTQLNFYNSGTQKGFIVFDNTDTRLIIQNASAGVYLASGGTSWISNSDERLKENLLPITDAVNKVSTLRAVTGNYINDANKKSRSFLIAQDVKAILPEAVDLSNPDQLGIAYTDVIPLLVAAIKELKSEIDLLKGN